MFSYLYEKKLGENKKPIDISAVGAVGAMGAIIGLLVNSFIGLSGGTNVLLARSVGAKDDERSKRSVGSSLILALAVVMSFVVQVILFAVIYRRYMQGKGKRI